MILSCLRIGIATNTLTMILVEDLMALKTHKVPRAVIFQELMMEEIIKRIETVFPEADLQLKIVEGTMPNLSLKTSQIALNAQNMIHPTFFQVIQAKIINSVATSSRT